MRNTFFKSFKSILSFLFTISIAGIFSLSIVNNSLFSQEKEKTATENKDLKASNPTTATKDKVGNKTPKKITPKKKKPKKSDTLIEDVKSDEEKKIEPAETLVKLKVMVLKFVNRSKFKEHNFFSDTLSDMMTNALIRTNNFVVESQDCSNKNIKELQIFPSDLYNDDVSTALGQLCKVDIVIAGNFFVYKDAMKIMIKAIDVSNGKVRAVYEKNVLLRGIIVISPLDNAISEIAEGFKKSIPPEPQRTVIIERIEKQEVIKERIKERIKEKIIYLEKTRKSGFGGIIKYNLGKSFYSLNPRADQQNNTLWSKSENMSFNNQFDISLHYDFLYFGLSYYAFKHDVMDYTEPKDPVTNEYPSGKYIDGVKVTDLMLKLGYRFPGFNDPYSFDTFYVSYRWHKAKFSTNRYYEALGPGLGYYSFSTINVEDENFDLLFDFDFNLGFFHKVKYTEFGTKLNADTKKNPNIGGIVGLSTSIGVLLKQYGAFILLTPYTEISYLMFQRENIDLGNPPDNQDRTKIPYGNLSVGLKFSIGFYFDSQVFLTSDSKK